MPVLEPDDSGRHQQDNQQYGERIWKPAFQKMRF
jgi:hypothetical protein